MSGKNDSTTQRVAVRPRRKRGSLNQMDVFISWAGNRSLAVAEALKDWIPMVINAAKPWLSKAHIPSGRLWRTELAENLATCKFGIFCLTPAALDSRWMFFEAGAISKTLADAHVCPLLVDLKISDVVSPFADFQCRMADRDGVFALMETVNSAFPDASKIPLPQLQSVFEILWPSLKARLDALPADDEQKREQRNPNEILEEILARVRALEQRRIESERPIETRVLAAPSAVPRSYELKAENITSRLVKLLPNHKVAVNVVSERVLLTVADGNGVRILSRIYGISRPSAHVVKDFVKRLSGLDNSVAPSARIEDSTEPNPT